MPKVETIEANHDANHIHLLLSIPAKMRVSDVVRRIKSTTVRPLKCKFDYMQKKFWGVDGILSDDYFVSMVVLNEGVIRRYIEK